MTEDIDPTADAKKEIEAQSKHRKTKKSAEAKAELEQDVERLNAKLNTERFLFAVTLVAIFDAWIFTKYESWSQAICLTFIEAGGLFVLARYLEIDEFISLMVDAIRQLRIPDKKPEDDPA